MGANSEMRSSPQAILPRNATLHSQFERGPVQFAGTDGYQRHLVFDKVVDPENAERVRVSLKLISRAETPLQHKVYCASRLRCITSLALSRAGKRHD
jgi:hypothetical protein